MFVNVIKSYRDVVAVCDKELLGKKFEEPSGEIVKQLDMKENFYKGEEADEEKALEVLQQMAKEDATFNLVGKKAVSVAIKSGIITEENVGEIGGVPFALVLI